MEDTQQKKSEKRTRKRLKDIYAHHIVEVPGEEPRERLGALISLGTRLRDRDRREPLSFDRFLRLAADRPELMFRDIFQLFHDMVHRYVRSGRDERSSDPESVGFAGYDCDDLFVRGHDNPFFADRLFANRLMTLVNGFKKGLRDNHIILFEGPPGSGKSTFLNTILQRLEEYVRTAEGSYFKTYWRLNIERLGGYQNIERPLRRAADGAESPEMHEHLDQMQDLDTRLPKKFLTFSCPSGDHPILQIPRSYRREFLDELIAKGSFKDKLFHRKEYEWVFKGIPCAICRSLYDILLDILGDPLEVFNMICARQMHFNRQFGSGISIFNPGDPVYRKPITNPRLQRLISDLLKNDGVEFIYSVLAKTNNGVYALMDIKENNIERLRDLHGIISDGVHKVDLTEERVKSLFVGLVNPEDKVHYQDVKSFQDRIITVRIPYILDYNTEVAVYRNKFGKAIDRLFLPGVLTNVAKIVVASRLEKDSPTIRAWIGDTDRYRKYMDADALLLKMDLYTGHIPDWLSEEDVRKFDRAVRTDLLAESEQEGFKGFSGRQSLNIFAQLLTNYCEPGTPITMEMVTRFFRQPGEPLFDEIPGDFLDSIEDLYDYGVLQEVRTALSFFNEDQISRDIQNYLFAINFDIGAVEKNAATGDTVAVTEEYLHGLEGILLGADASERRRAEFREETHAEYVTVTVTQEMKVEGKELRDTALYRTLFDRYTRNLRENALAPYAANENFRRAVTDLGTAAFSVYDERIQRDVRELIRILRTKFRYTQEGARQIALYVIEKKLHEKY
ncbi:MAG TPA: serine protein kinase PrkA [bacterium]|nr:serine protein kinase PrkA [bacterium]